MFDNLAAVALVGALVGLLSYRYIVAPFVDILWRRWLMHQVWADLERARTSTTHADPGRPAVRTLAPCLRVAGAGAHGLALVSPVRPVREPEPWSPTRLHAYRAELAEFGLSLDDSRIE